MLGAFGTIDNPFGTSGYNNPRLAAGTQGEGLILILSSLIRLSIILAGIYTLINLILAGYGYLSANGDPKMVQKAHERIWRSFLGLAIVTGSLVIASVIGLFLYGINGWNTLISPRIFTP